MVILPKDYTTDLVWLRKRYDEVTALIAGLDEVNRQSLHDAHGKIKVNEELYTALKVRQYNLARAYREMAEKASK